MSCVSLPNCIEREEQGRFEPAEVSWPRLVQGIRVYAVQHPPKVASELLEWADFAEGLARLQDPGGEG